MLLSGTTPAEFAGWTALVLAVIGALPKVIAILTRSRGEVHRSQIEMAAAEVSQFDTVFQAQGKLLDDARNELKELRARFQVAEDRIEYLERLLGSRSRPRG
jgi:hypothetical protein